MVQGTGKTRLAQVALETAFGTDYARMLAVGDGEEARKQITATLKDLPRGVLLDNVDKMLDSAPLAKVLRARPSIRPSAGRSCAASAMAGRTS